MAGWLGERASVTISHASMIQTTRLALTVGGITVAKVRTPGLREAVLSPATECSFGLRNNAVHPEPTAQRGSSIIDPSRASSR